MCVRRCAIRGASRLRTLPKSRALPVPCANHIALAPHARAADRATRTHAAARAATQIATHDAPLAPPACVMGDDDARADFEPEFEQDEENERGGVRG